MFMLNDTAPLGGILTGPVDFGQYERSYPILNGGANVSIRGFGRNYSFNCCASTTPGSAQLSKMSLEEAQATSPASNTPHGY